MSIRLEDLPLLGASRVEKLAQAKISSLHDLVAVNPSDLESHAEFANDQGFLRKTLPMVQGYARAHLANEALVLAKDSRVMDESHPILHIDLEFDGPRNEIFLWGLLWHDQDKVESWFGVTKREQVELLQRFRALVKERDPVVVTWGGATSDVGVIERACQAHKIPHAWVRKIRWFDLQNDVIYTGTEETQRIFLPVTRFKSDNVAGYFGYVKPQLAIKDGYSALKAYRKYRKREDEVVKQNLIAYNAEDVYHTQLILNGLRSLMADA